MTDNTRLAIAVCNQLYAMGMTPNTDDEYIYVHDEDSGELVYQSRSLERVMGFIDGLMEARNDR